MRFGILGLPKTGKTTLFNILTGAHAATDKYAHSKESHLAVASVPDSRLDGISALLKPAKTVPVHIDYVDFPGLARGEFQGLDLGQFRDVKGIVHVARAFEDPEILHVEGGIDPARDVEIVGLELVMSDLGVVERRIPRLEKEVQKIHTDELQRELEVLKICRDALEKGTPLRQLDLDDLQEQAIRGYSFLSLKPLVHAINVGEDSSADAESPGTAFGLEETPSRAGEALVGFCGSLEEEIADLDEADAVAFREDAGLTESGLERLVQVSHRLLGMITFYTASEKEVHAWTVRRGARAQEAAGRIHSDMERGFIRAEVVPAADLLETGGWAGARDHGKVRLEGKDYIVQDGDVIHIRFNI